MKKDLFDDIEIPTAELDESIHKGIQKGRQKNKRKNTKMTKVVKATLVIAASLMITFGLGFVSDPVANAMSSLPIIGETLEGFYTVYNERAGSVDNLPEQSQIQEDGMIVSDQGIDCQMLGAYNYHNGTIGIFFQYSGDVNKRAIENGEGPESGFSYYVGDSEKDQDQPYTRASHTLEEVDDTYVCQLELEFEDEYAENLETLPITFTYLGGKEGEWHFDVPIQEDPSYTDLGGEAYSNGAVTAQFDSLYQEEGITKIYCTLTIDNGSQVLPDGTISGDHLSDDQISITFKDDRGQELPVARQEIPSASGKSNSALITYPIEIELASSIPEGCQYITAFVEVTLDSGEKVVLDPIQLDL